MEGATGALASAIRPINVKIVPTPLNNNIRAQKYSTDHGTLDVLKKN